MAITKWQMDPAHSEIQFKVKHMMVSNVTGEFKKFNIVVETEEHDFSTAKISFTADIDSINTRVEQRDNHLKSADFFDAANHPQMKFESTKITKKSDDEYDLEGNLTIRETTMPVSMEVEHVGMIQDDYGFQRAGFELRGKINRKQFGLNYNALMEAGGLVVADEVRINANVEITHPVEVKA